MEKLNILITGIGGGGHGEQILKALKLSSLDLHIIGADMSEISKGLFEVDIPYIIPAASHKNYIDVLLQICKKHNVKVLFHGSEPELKVMSEHRKIFHENGIFLPINPQHVLDVCMDKAKTMEFLKENNFFFPETKVIKSEADLEDVNFVPCVLKPSIGGGGSANIMLAQSIDELKMFGKYLLTIYNEFIVQQYVGTPEDEYTAGVLMSMNGQLINSIAIRRNIMSSLSNRIKVANRTGVADYGKMLAISSGISQGFIDRFPEITTECERIALALGCTGAVNIQLRYWKGKVYVFEINPRFSGTTSLRAMVGYNEPEVLIRKHVLNEEIEIKFNYKSGYISRGLQEYYIDSNYTFNKIQ